MTAIVEKKTNPMRALFSRLLHTYFFMTRGLTIGVRAIVRSEDGKFLLVKHTYTPGWHFPGGGVEKGETIEQALRKELMQETGLQLIGKPLLHGVFYNNAVSKRDHVLTYNCDVIGNVLNKSNSMEIADIGYFNIENLPEEIEPGTLRRIHEVTGHADLAQTW